MAKLAEACDRLPGGHLVVLDQGDHGGALGADVVVGQQGKRGQALGLVAFGTVRPHQWSDVPGVGDLFPLLNEGAGVEGAARRFSAADHGQPARDRRFEGTRQERLPGAAPILGPVVAVIDFAAVDLLSLGIDDNGLRGVGGSQFGGEGSATIEQDRSPQSHAFGPGAGLGPRNVGIGEDNKEGDLSLVVGGDQFLERGAKGFAAFAPGREKEKGPRGGDGIVTQGLHFAGHIDGPQGPGDNRGALGALAFGGPPRGLAGQCRREQSAEQAENTDERAG